MTVLRWLGAYLFNNGRQKMSLRWLAFFHDIKRARDANWGQVCLAYLYSLDALSRGTLRQLVGPWKLFEVNRSPWVGAPTVADPNLEAGLAAGAPIDPLRLQWSVYVCGPDGFAPERSLGRNTNVMG
ncbi:hypothetical protein SO802_002536 [Lithocarpus litseifolius]|uniref:Aminotransferase-like plant mobile domain-containing protein n=1 Tax=Lithocarpus litseifolius TaxID=425828 RepID=A0AAW2E038_9ROSI